RTTVRPLQEFPNLLRRTGNNLEKVPRQDSLAEVPNGLVGTLSAHDSLNEAPERKIVKGEQFPLVKSFPGHYSNIRVNRLRDSYGACAYDFLKPAKKKRDH